MIVTVMLWRMEGHTDSERGCDGLRYERETFKNTCTVGNIFLVSICILFILILWSDWKKKLDKKKSDEPNRIQKKNIIYFEPNTVFTF